VPAVMLRFTHSNPDRPLKNDEENQFRQKPFRIPGRSAVCRRVAKQIENVRRPAALVAPEGLRTSLKRKRNHHDRPPGARICRSAGGSGSPTFVTSIPRQNRAQRAAVLKTIFDANRHFPVPAAATDQRCERQRNATNVAVNLSTGIWFQPA